MDAMSVVDVCSSIGRIHQQRRSNNQWNQATKRLALQCKESPLTWCREVTSVRPVLGKRQLRTDLQELRSDIGQLSNTEFSSTWRVTSVTLNVRRLPCLAILIIYWSFSWNRVDSFGVLSFGDPFVSIVSRVGLQYRYCLKLIHYLKCGVI